MGRKLIESDFQVIKYFRPEELGAWWELEVNLITRADQFREALGVPVKVASAFRTPEQNRDAGGAPDSQHLYGRALDLQPRGSNIFSNFIAAERVGFNGIGLYDDGHIHVDTRPGFGARWAEGAGGEESSIGVFLSARGYNFQVPEGLPVQVAGVGFDPEMAAVIGIAFVGWLVWRGTDPNR